MVHGLAYQPTKLVAKYISEIQYIIVDSLIRNYNGSSSKRSSLTVKETSGRVLTSYEKVRRVTRKLLGQGSFLEIRAL